MNTIIIIVAVYALCGVAAYGLTFWYFQDAFPTLAKAEAESDARFAAKIATGGPFSLLSILIHIPRQRWSRGEKPIFRYRLRFSAK